MKRTARAGGFSLLLLCGMCASAATSGESGGALRAYLLDSRAEDRPGALASVKAAQVIFLHFERDTPTDMQEERAFVDSLKASSATMISIRKDGKEYYGISATFSDVTSVGEVFTLPREDWLGEMRRPIEAGYKLKSIDIILRPSPRVQKRSFDRSQQVVRDVASQLEALKPDFGQLQEFSAASLRLGTLEAGQPPHYPHLWYEHDAKTSQRTKGYEHTSANWCTLSLEMGLIDGQSRQGMPSGARRYPLQGIYVAWDVRSGNKDFDKRFVQIVTDALKPLDTLEAELGGGKQAADAKAPPAMQWRGQQGKETPPRQ